MAGKIQTLAIELLEKADSLNRSSNHAKKVLWVEGRMVDGGWMVDG